MYGKFLVEGDKLVRELLLSNFKVDAIYRTQNAKFETDNSNTSVFEVSEADLEKISTHQNPNQVVAVAYMQNQRVNIEVSEPGIVVVCDNVSDPGNAGTIIRSAEWFGAKAVLFSNNSVEIYNPKVVSAAKGSLFRMNCGYADPKEIFAENTQRVVYGTYMEGESVYTAPLQQNAFIIIGNEANGIGKELIPFIHHKISIPSMSKAESLNAGVAASVVLSEFARRRTL